MANSVEDLNLKLLVDEIADRLAEYAKVSDYPLESKLRPPATPEAIDAFERRRNVILPDDYRMFLSLHDGWEYFSGENALLSIAEMTSGPIFDGHKELQSELGRLGQKAAAGGLIFEGGLGTRIAYFDLSAKQSPVSYEVVFWHINEIARFATFADYLRDYAKTLDQMIADEREKLR
jgi:SMI1 / KNR4 family (SUKH-1)